MLAKFVWRALTEIDPRLLWKFAVNCGLGAVHSVAMFKARLRRGRYFPPFLFISVTSSCQLRCQGCWVDVDRPRRMIPPARLDALIGAAERLGNRFFGILGGEPLLYEGLPDILAAHPRSYFQLFTNGHLLTDEYCRRLRRLGNVTPLVSIEGSETVSDLRRGRHNVLAQTLEGLENCRRHRLITGVATSVCRNNIDDLVSEQWLRRLIDLGVHYVWYYLYRPVGPRPEPQLALSMEQALAVRRFIVEMRCRMPIGIIDAYWDDKGESLCPMATGVSHHISPGGDVEPCPVIQFAVENIAEARPLYELVSRSRFLADLRAAAARATRGCVLLERPDVLLEVVRRHRARDTTQRGTALAELEAMKPMSSQYTPGALIPEKSRLYRFAKKHWFFGFGAYA